MLIGDIFVQNQRSQSSSETLSCAFLKISKVLLFLNLERKFLYRNLYYKMQKKNYKYQEIISKEIIIE